MSSKWMVMALCFGFAATAAGADVTALVKDCQDCHGDKGISRWDDVPTIAGVSPAVLSDAMLDYQEKQRPCVSSEYRQGDTKRDKTDMCVIADKLSEDEIDALAEHFADLPFVAAKQTFDAALVKQGKIIHDRDCEKCHADGGTNPEEDAGILAGQWTRYLKEQFGFYKDGKRRQAEKMEAKVKTLSDQDVAALLAFYASTQ